MQDHFLENYDDVSLDFYAKGNGAHFIDLETWQRKRLFYNYLGTDFPYIIMTANIDVTGVLQFAKKNKVSFNLCMCYLCNKVSNSIENYRYRFKDGKPFIVDYNRPIVNHLIPGEDEFVMGEGPWPCDDILEFARVTHARQEAAKPSDMQELVRYKLDIINYTSIPWVQYSAFIRTIIHNGVDSAPKISFGKYFIDYKPSASAGAVLDNEFIKGSDLLFKKRVLLPVSSQTHHGLMDGCHVGKFYELLQKECDRF